MQLSCSRQKLGADPSRSLGYKADLYHVKCSGIRLQNEQSSRFADWIGIVFCTKCESQFQVRADTPLILRVQPERINSNRFCRVGCEGLLKRSSLAIKETVQILA